MEWNWPIADEKQINNAKDNRLKIVKIDYVNGEPVADIIGTSDEYTTTLRDCECKAFIVNNVRKSPCKHMILLGMKLGLLNENGHTPEQEKELRVNDLMKRIASAYGWYYYFGEPEISDAEYDSMKSELALLISGKA